MLLDNRLFVYGTLAPNQPNARISCPSGWPIGRRPLLSAPCIPKAGAQQWAILPFKLIGTDSVKGFLLESPDLPGFWDELDEFEGADYRRVEVTAYPENGDAVQSFIYALNDQR